MPAPFQVYYVDRAVIVARDDEEAADEFERHYNHRPETVEETAGRDLVERAWSCVDRGESPPFLIGFTA